MPSFKGLADGGLKLIFFRVSKRLFIESKGLALNVYHCTLNHLAVFIGHSEKWQSKATKGSMLEGIGLLFDYLVYRDLLYHWMLLMFTILPLCPQRKLIFSCHLPGNPVHFLFCPQALHVFILGCCCFVRLRERSCAESKVWYSG